MNQLLLSIQVEGGSRRWRVPATVRALDADFVRETVVTTGGAAVAVDALDAGRYIVEAYLPSGERLRRTVTIADGPPTLVQLRVPRSPHEWLESPARMVAANRFRPVPAMLANAPALTQLAGTPSPFAVMRDLLDGQPLPSPTALAPTIADGTNARFDVDIHMSSSSAHGSVVVAHHWTASRAVAVPSPWRTLDGQEAHFEIVANLSTGAMSTTVQDELFAPVLGYLASGHVELAMRALDEQSLELLQAKVMNPYAAAAGAYVLLQRALSGAERHTRWRDWVRNLSNWFPELPDGHILRGTLLLNNLAAHGDTGQPAGCFARAADLGVPLFSTGVRLLYDGMLSLGAKDARVKWVRRLAAHLETDEPFTTLRLEDRT